MSSEIDSLTIEDPLMFFVYNYSSINAKLQKENISDADFEENIELNYKSGQKKFKKWNLILKQI